jgi:hypothetical protein
MNFRAGIDELLVFSSVLESVISNVGVDWVFPNLTKSIVFCISSELGEWCNVRLHSTREVKVEKNQFEAAQIESWNLLPNAVRMYCYVLQWNIHSREEKSINKMLVKNLKIVKKFKSDIIRFYGDKMRFKINFVLKYFINLRQQN